MVCVRPSTTSMRLYVDSKCLFHHKPLLVGNARNEGQHASCGSSLTEHYGATRDPPKVDSVCTLKTSPTRSSTRCSGRGTGFCGVEISFVCSMAWRVPRHRRAAPAMTSSPTLDPRRLRAFKQVPDDVNQFKAGNDAFAQELNVSRTRSSTRLRVKTNLVDQRPSSYQDCVAWARLNSSSASRLHRAVTT